MSLALGAFIAGMLISETEYRYQVEDDIKPFRDVLLGLFFVTIGMKLDLALVYANLPWVRRSRCLLLIVFEGLLIAGLSRLFGSDTGAALRTGLDLAQGGEFGFVLLSLAAPLNLVPEAHAADGAGGDGAVDAGRAVHHRAQRAHRAPFQRRRLAGARDGIAQRRGAVDGGEPARGGVRLRAQRPESGAPARHGRFRFYRARCRSEARARKPPRRASTWCTATPRGAKC